MNPEQAVVTGAMVREMLESDAWKIVIQELGYRIDALEAMKENSYDPNVHFGCNKEICGIMMVTETANRLVEDGYEASQELQV